MNDLVTLPPSDLPKAPAPPQASWRWWLLQGVISGIPLAWFMGVVGRVLWDDIPLWTLMEAWLALILLASSLILAHRLAGPSAKNTWSTAVAAFSGVALGVVGVFVWNLQMLEHRADQDYDTTTRVNLPIASVLGYLTEWDGVPLTKADPACVALRQVWSKGIEGNPEWVMTPHSKLWIKDRWWTVLEMGCISENDMFAAVQHLRHRPTDAGPKGTATFDWAFQPTDHVARQDWVLNQMLPITQKEWCSRTVGFAAARSLHQTTSTLKPAISATIQTFCASADIPSDIVLAPSTSTARTTFTRQLLQDISP